MASRRRFQMDNRDVYAHVALGNIYYTVAADAAKHTHNGEDAKEKENKYQNYALRNYRNGKALPLPCVCHGLRCGDKWLSLRCCSIRAREELVDIRLQRDRARAGRPG